MPDLRMNPARLQQLVEHIGKKEGRITHFYCDSARPRGLVTIGIGELVDQRGAAKPAARAVAEAWYERRKTWLQFHDRNTLAPVHRKEDILNDWMRAFAHGTVHPGLGARAYAPVTQYRISTQHADQLLQQKLKTFIEGLYLAMPFATQLDELIAMALIDARYNNARVAVYDLHRDPGDHFHPDIPVMWRHLDPSSGQYNVEEALLLFERIWQHRGSARYRERHRVRVLWFYTGVTRMMGRAGPVNW